MATARKAAPTKKAAKKPNPNKELQPFIAFEGYPVRTSTYDNEIVEFGCGDVRVRKSDLKVMATLAEDKLFRETCKTLSTDLDTDALATLIGLPLSVLENFIKLKKNAKYRAGLVIAKGWYEGNSSYVELSDIFNYSSMDYKRLAITPISED